MLTMQDISRAFAEEATEYPLVKAYLFGSRARGDEKPDSDVDIFLDVGQGFSLFDLCGLTNALERRLGVPCDVMTRRGLKDEVRANAECDEVLIYER